MLLQLCGKWQSVEARTTVISHLVRGRSAPKVSRSNGRGCRQSLNTHRSAEIVLNGRYFDRNSTPVASHLTAAQMTRSKTSARQVALRSSVSCRDSRVSSKIHRGHTNHSHDFYRNLSWIPVNRLCCPHAVLINRLVWQFFT
jgi:hypothetical protein